MWVFMQCIVDVCINTSYIIYAPNYVVCSWFISIHWPISSMGHSENVDAMQPDRYTNVRAITSSKCIQTGIQTDSGVYGCGGIDQGSWIFEIQWLFPYLLEASFKDSRATCNILAYCPGLFEYFSATCFDILNGRRKFQELKGINYFQMYFLLVYD